MPLFCRHNRYTAECPICSKGTVLDRGAAPPRRRRTPTARRRQPAAPSFLGPYARAGPYADEGDEYEVRLETVPGGLRLAEWAAGALRRRAPVLAAADLPGLLAEAGERASLRQRDTARLRAALARGTANAEGVVGRSPGRAGELRDELRVEALPGGRVRVARWVLRPGRGWELQEAPVMLPAARFAEAVASAPPGSMRP
jgi:hypothetical protein